jgi:hypothetical protein
MAEQAASRDFAAESTESTESFQPQFLGKEQIRIMGLSNYSGFRAQRLKLSVLSVLSAAGCHLLACATILQVGQVGGVVVDLGPDLVRNDH